LSVKKTRKKLAEVTGVLEKSVRRKVKKWKLECCASTFVQTPCEERLVSSPKSTLDNFNECVIYNIL
jgi:hypothetical protein